MISLIAAIAEERVIGKNGELPWRFPADLRRFRSLTLGKPVIMGRKTYESLPVKPLPGRMNIVLTSDLSYYAPGCIVRHSLHEVMDTKEVRDAEEVIVMGGEAVYRLFLPYTKRMYLTRIFEKFDGDAYFPEYDIFEWNEVHFERHEKDIDNPFAHCFMILERR